MAKIKVESKFLSEEDMPVEGDLIVTISDIQKQLVGQGEKAQQKWILFFKEAKKGLVLNATNIKTLTTLFHSDDSDDWMGQKIAVWYNPDVEMMGEIVGGLRIRHKLPGKASAKVDAPQPRDGTYPLTVEEIIYRLDHAESVGQIASIMNDAMGIKDLSVENLKSLMVIKDQRIDAITAKA